MSIKTYTAQFFEKKSDRDFLKKLLNQKNLVLKEKVLENYLFWKIQQFIWMRVSIV